MRCQSAGLGDGRPLRHALEPSYHRKCQLRFAPARIGKSYDLCGHGSRIGGGYLHPAQRSRGALLFPNLVNLLSSLESFNSAFRDTDDCHLQRRSIDTANRWLDRILCVRASDDLLGIAQDRDIRVRRTKKALPRLSFTPSSLCQFRQNLPFHASKPTPSPRLGHSGRCRDPLFVSLLS